MARNGRPRGGVDGGNRADNPLRPLRMVMLQHGFLDQKARRGFKPDDDDRLNYGLVRLRTDSFPIGAAVSLVVILLAIIVAVVVL